MFEFQLMRFAVSLRNGALVSICDPLGYLHVLSLSLSYSTCHSIHLSIHKTIHLLHRVPIDIFIPLCVVNEGFCDRWSMIGDRWSMIVDRWSLISVPVHSIIDHLLHTWWRVNYCEAFAIDFAWFIGPRVLCVYAFGRRSFWLRFIMPSATEFVYKHCNF